MKKNDTAGGGCLGGSVLATWQPWVLLKDDGSKNGIAEAPQSCHCDLKFLRMKFGAFAEKCLEEGRSWLSRPHSCINMSF